jgi:predicted RNase H-like HicB family nuclease
MNGLTDDILVNSKEVMKYCSSLGKTYDDVVEDMERQSRGLQG